MPDPVGSEELLRSYKALYTSARETVRRLYPELERRSKNILHSHDGSNEATISYNLAMTTRRMMICPRRSETATISDSTVPLKNSSGSADSQEAPPAHRRTRPSTLDNLASDNTTKAIGSTMVSQIGPIALNGTILAGTLMVKTEEEWNLLRGTQGPRLLEGILEQVGLPVTEEEEIRSLKAIMLS